MPTADKAALRERLRLRALARFFAPNHITADIVRSSHDSQPLSPSLSESTQLTAIAQNGALKLQCDRTFVSLIDASSLYVVAEATRSISLRDSNRYSTPQDALLLGVQYLDKSYGICPNSFAIFTDPTGRFAIDTHDVVSNATRHVIRDLRSQEEHKDRPYVVGFPYLRSYVEVPLKTSDGQVLGSYCAMDTRVRDDFFDDETIFTLTEIAQCITDYFELQAVKYNHARGEQLMRGLAEFTRGRSHFPRENGPEQKDVSPSRPGARAKCTPCCSEPSNQESLSPASTPTEPGSDCASVDSLSTCSTGSTRLTSPSEDPDLLCSAEDHMSNICDSPSSRTPSPEPPKFANIFSHAASLIRGSMDLEGLVFLDGSAKTKHHSSVPASELGEMPCEVLGSSLASTNCALDPTNASLLLHESSLKYLVDEHPNGCIFLADEYGVLYTDEEKAPVAQRDVQNLSRDNNLPQELQTLVSKARSIIFLPLWDYSKESVFVGLVGWSTDPTRVFEEPDMTCLSAFGNTFMTELARSEAVAIARAKSDFLSSVSHELRSPLHGILASVEFLEETTLDGTQSDLTGMIRSCGSTLLDTLNHLLDFSKINEFTDAKNNARKSTSDNKQGTCKNPLGQYSKDYLCRLVQDVVEGVHFGQASQQATLDRTQAAPFDAFKGREKPVDPAILIEYGDGIRSSSPKQAVDVVGVFLTMENRADWYITLCAGAWKRIVMNLFANSLKYTNRGCIEISLSLITDTWKPRKRTVHLMVKDTGIGMSEEYIKHHLYQPFAQENPLAAGTGLGLSIVKQIVEDLGGSINVQSAVGSGTRFDLLIPVPEPDVEGQVEPHPPGGLLLDPTGELRGRTLCLLSETCPKEHTDPQLDSQRRRTAAMKSNITTVATDWFQMKVISARTPNEVDADLYVAEASYIKTLLQTNHQGSMIFHSKRLILIDPLQTFCKDKDPAGNMTRSTYLISPKSLYKALSAAMKATKGSTSCDGAAVYLGSTVPAARPTLHSRRSAAAALPDSKEISASAIVTEKKAQVEKPIQPETKEESASKHHLLLVDDNAINLRILSSYVKKLGISSATAENGLEAYETYRASDKPFTMVLMDLSMPVMNGFDSSRAIRDYETRRPDRVPRATRIVALTGLGSESSRHEATRAGIDEFRIKPVALKVLKELLEAT